MKQMITNSNLPFALPLDPKTQLIYQYKHTQNTMKLTLQISSPWNPPATSSFSFTERELT